MWSKDLNFLVKFPILLGFLTVYLLSGCLGKMGINSNHHLIGLDTISKKYCAKERSLTQKANWNTADIVNEGIKNKLYESGLITLWQNKPYIIKITNKDGAPRTFRAPVFLRNAALSKVIYKNEIFKEPCLNAVTLAPKSSAELYLIPLKKGNYDYHETVFWAWLFGEIFEGSDVGLIQVL